VQDNEPVVVMGVRGMKSKTFTKRFRSLTAAMRWLESDAAGDCTIYEVARAN
jgi:hypothetical protein